MACLLPAAMGHGPCMVFVIVTVVILLVAMLFLTPKMRKAGQNARKRMDGDS
jgi:hypothetical protein